MIPKIKANPKKHKDIITICKDFIIKRKLIQVSQKKLIFLTQESIERKLIMSSGEEDMFEMSKKMITIEKLFDKKEDLEEIACQIRESDKYLTNEIETLEKESDIDDIYSELQDILAPYYDELVDLTDNFDKQADTTVNLRRFEIFKENVRFLFENLLDIEKKIINLQE